MDITMIGIIDYGMGNLHSVQKAFERVGADAKILTQPDEINNVEKLVLPGVGAFADAARTLRDMEFVAPILDFIASGRKFLGICLGLQLLFDVSYENGEHTGLGVIPGEVVKFDFSSLNSPYKLKIPHMGWNTLTISKDVPIFAGIEANPSVYFVHSYYVVPKSTDVVAASTFYGYEFTSAVWKGNIFAVQFHPEKSQKTGLKILENFSKL
jgi:glutamine amidotransferase